MLRSKNMSELKGGTGVPPLDAPCPVPLGGTMANAPSGIAGGGIALRFGAKRVRPRGGRTLFTRRSVRGIFPGVHAAGKNDPVLSAVGDGGNQEGAPAPSWTFPGTVGRGTGARSAACFYLWCLLSGSPRSGIAGGRAAAAAGRGTGDGRGRFAVRRGRGTGDGRQARTLCCAPGTRDGGRGVLGRGGSVREKGKYGKSL